MFLHGDVYGGINTTTEKTVPERYEQMHYEERPLTTQEKRRFWGIPLVLIVFVVLIFILSRGQ